MIKRSWKTVRRWIPVSLGILIFPKIFLIYFLLGMIDLSRNTGLQWSTIKLYFIGHGNITWLLSPFNLLMDLFCYRNKYVYKLTDLPSDYQSELNALISMVNQNKDQLIAELQDKLANKKRGMIFFKWYGKNMNHSLSVQGFEKNFKYIKTIGISIFNKKQSTAEHFGPLRISLRFLYNFTPINSEQVYIQVGTKKHIWKDDPIFIFDDTLLHKSMNESDQVRYCLFVDILRPSFVPKLLSYTLNAVRYLTIRTNNIFYRNWDFLK